MTTQITNSEGVQGVNQNPVNKKHSNEFMLEEFRFLKASYEGTMTWRENRFRNYINIIFGSVALLTIVAQFSNSTSALNYTVVAISSIVYFYGLFVFTRLVSGTFSVWKYLRAINKVREYFVDLDNSVNDYLLVPVKGPDAERQPETTLGKGLIGTTVLTNSLLGLVFGFALTLEVLNLTVWVSFGFGIVLAICSWLLHSLYYQREYRNKRGNVK
jgi:hypothetical protein